MEPTFTVRLFGGISIESAGRSPVRLRVTKPSLLFGLLAINLETALSRDKIIDMLWPEPDVANGHHSLRQALSLISKNLRDAGVEKNAMFQADRSSVSLNPTTFTTDIRLLRAANDSISESTGADERLNIMRRAVALYTGDLLPGYYDDWVVLLRDRATVVFLQILTRLIAELQHLGRHEEALEHALRSAEIDPGSGQVCSMVCKLYIYLERETEAVRYFELYRDRRMREDQEPPAAALLRLIEPYMKGARGSAAESHDVGSAGVGKDARQTSLGRIVKLEGAMAPPNRFFGRDKELGQIMGWLAAAAGVEDSGRGNSKARLVTIVGPGGWGKTRLAIEAAQQLRSQFFGRAVYVSLKGAARTDSVTHCLANALQLSIAGADTVELVRNELADGPWLVILDDCERSRAVRSVVRKLLGAVHDLRILATAPMPIGIDGEQVLTLRPLAVPRSVSSIGALEEFPSFQMFVARAQAVSPDLEVTCDNVAAISAIVERLDGIPLAIELAAAHSLVLSPTELLAALKDRFDLLVSRRPVAGSLTALKDTIEWSFRLLGEEARRLFVELSVFGGSFTIGAAREICDTPNFRANIEELTERALLEVDHNRGSVRFSMLDSLHEFAAKRLDSGDRAALGSRHADYYLRVLRDVSSRLRTGEQAAALRSLDSDHPNILEAIRFAGGEPDELRLAVAASGYWRARGLIDLGIRSIRKALKNPDPALADRAEALHHLGVFLEHQDALDAAEEALRSSIALTHGELGLERAFGLTLNSLAILLEKRTRNVEASECADSALGLLRDYGDDQDVAACLNTLGRLRWHAKHPDEAEGLLREALAKFERGYDWPRAAAVVCNLGCIASDAGNLDNARAAFERATALFRELDQPVELAYALQNLGDTVCRQGDIVGAIGLLLESLSIRHQLGDRSGEASVVEALADAYNRGGDSTHGARLLAGASAMRERFDTPLDESRIQVYNTSVEEIRGGLSDADFRAARAFGLAIPPESLALFARDRRIIAVGHRDEGPEVGPVRISPRLF